MGHHKKRFAVVSVTEVLKKITDGKPQPFERRLVHIHGRSLIESLCFECGFRMVGSVSDGLPKKELEHLVRHRNSGGTAC